MEENKNINPSMESETSAEETVIEVTEAAEAVEEISEEVTVEAAEETETAEATKKQKKEKKAKAPKVKLLKNQALFKKGSYSAAITAAFIAAVIVLNILVGALSDRFVLEFDMSTEKINSISEENLDFIKSVEDKVEVVVCADADEYASGGMAYYAQQYSVQQGQSDADYYKQTINLIDRYADYNKKINVKYIDIQSSEFLPISEEYNTEQLTYGDVIVSCEKNGNKRHKKVGFEDIYSLTEDQTYAAYGMSASTLSGNNIETALTSAISYVTSNETKKLAFITGHSTNDLTQIYQNTLKLNNYEIDIISDSIINSIPEKYDAVVIAAPNTDFMGDELDAISAFLDNNGKLDKGLIFIADVTAPYLTNLYDFLAQWGIAVDEGIVFETEEGNHMPDDPMTLGSYSSGADKITQNVQICITGSNVPLSAAFESENGIKVTSLVETPATTVAAPKGTAANWTGADKYTPQSYSTIIQAVKEDYDDDNNPIASYVMAFGSVEFIYSDYAEYEQVQNKNMTLAVAERAVGAEDGGVYFAPKTISEESFAEKVTEQSTGVIRIIFMFLLPIASLVAGVVIYIKRRNA